MEIQTRIKIFYLKSQNWALNVPEITVFMIIKILTLLDKKRIGQTNAINSQQSFLNLTYTCRIYLEY